MATITITNAAKVEEEIVCKNFIFGYTGIAPGNTGVINYVDCGGVTRSDSMTWEESDGNYYTITICAQSIISVEGYATDVTDYGAQTNCGGGA